MTGEPEIVEFDGRIWSIHRSGDFVSYQSNLGSEKHPRPKTLTRYVWERARGRPAPGYKVVAIDGNYLNWDISNLKLVRGDSKYVELDRERRRKMVLRDDFLHAATAAGWNYDDAWDRWSADASRARRDLGLEDEDPG